MRYHSFVSIYRLKLLFQDLLRPIVQCLVRLGVTANFVTIFSMILSIVVGVVLVFGIQEKILFLIIPITLFVRMALNAIDGMIAKEHNMKTNLGVFLNELSDVISDTALYLPFALIPGTSSFLIISIVIQSILSEMAGVISVQIGSSRRYDGPMGKSDRAFVFGLLAILYVVFETSFVIQWADTIYWIINGLILVTIVNRAHSALKEKNG